eukprot:GHVS01082712.1.p1 GENE.GHVS01082712.1~~GHVS01082712.1.p1  ORF type:complete len:185 (-),score=34.27 GHVS01082712.1:272-826(-)
MYIGLREVQLRVRGNNNKQDRRQQPSDNADELQEVKGADGETRSGGGRQKADGETGTDDGRQAGCETLGVRREDSASPGDMVGACVLASVHALQLLECRVFRSAFRPHVAAGGVLQRRPSSDPLPTGHTSSATSQVASTSRHWGHRKRVELEGVGGGSGRTRLEDLPNLIHPLDEEESKKTDRM